MLRSQRIIIQEYNSAFFEHTLCTLRLKLTEVNVDKAGKAETKNRYNADY